MIPANAVCLTSTSAATDTFVNQVALMMHMEGTHGQGTFTDSSTNAGVTNILESSGSPQVTTANKKYGVGSYAGVQGAAVHNQYASGVAPGHWSLLGQYGAFTIDAWAYLNTVGTSGTGIIASLGTTRTLTWPSTGPLWHFGVQSTGTGFASIFKFLTTDSQVGTIAGNTVISSGSWTHIAISGDGTTVRSFVGGVTQTATAAVAAFHPYRAFADFFTAGNVNPQQFSTSGYAWEGQIDELRVTTSCRYTQDFIPPNRPGNP